MRHAIGPRFHARANASDRATGGPGAELATLEDAARSVGLMKPWRQTRLHWDYAAELLLKGAKTREEGDIGRHRSRNGADGVRVAR